MRVAERTLGRDALDRLGRMSRPEGRQRFIVSRALLPLVAARQLGCDPSTVTVHERRGKAPLVSTDAQKELHVSLSHSGVWVACVMATSPVGVDVESVDRRLDAESLSASFFTPQEDEWLRRRANPRLAFFRLWTGKEAVFKAAHETGWNGAVLDVHFPVEGDTLGVPAPARVLRHELVDGEVACSLAEMNGGETAGRGPNAALQLFRATDALNATAW